MGTKRLVVPRVLSLFDVVARPGAGFSDLFAGTGSVGAAMVDRVPVTLNDALGFPALLGRARFLNYEETLSDTGKSVLTQMASAIARRILRDHTSAVEEEREALALGQEATRALIESARHAGNDRGIYGEAQSCHTNGDYHMVRQYFARGYFSTEQAIVLDAYRAAIDAIYPAQASTENHFTIATPRDRVLAAWIVAASRIANGPGHTAQFLRANSQASFSRVASYWRRSVPWEFDRALDALEPIGTTGWRQKNRVFCMDATSLSEHAKESLRGSVLYADPPYTKDHYSRFYHVLETMLKYDYPSAHGQARARSDRHASAFSLKTQAQEAFSKLGALASELQCSLIVSYPSSGLLCSSEIEDAFSLYGTFSLAVEFAHHHSTMGGSPGRASSGVQERLYVLTP